MAVIVTGATGFIGSHLVDALVEAGEEVRCLVRSPGPVDSPRAARYHVANFCRADLGVADSVFDGVDVVYHLAGATRATSEAAFREANVEITKRLIDRAGRAGSPPRFVYVSSQAAAGPTPAGQGPLSENERPAPVEAYGRSKLEAERVVESRSSEIPVTILRPVAVYGPRDRDFLPVFRLMRRGIAIYPGIRDATVTTILVDDLVRGIIDAARSPRTVGQTYFMGNSTFATWREIYREVADAVGRNKMTEVDIPLPLVQIGSVAGSLVGLLMRRPPLLSVGKAALAAPRFWTCSSARANTDFGFAATTSLHDGMRATYDWYIRQRWL
jgi:nucleoside-diphosphate-sugar epimerase